MTSKTSKTQDNQISAQFRETVSALLDAAQPIDATPDAAPLDWKAKTAPPTRCPVALADAKNDPIIAAWTRRRLMESKPGIEYKIARLDYLGRLYGNEKEDATQQALTIALERMDADPAWGMVDNALIAHDAAQRVRGTLHKATTKAAPFFGGSLDEYTDASQDMTRMDAVSNALMEDRLTFYGNRDETLSKSVLLDALEDLPDAQRSAFSLMYYWGYTARELAEKQDKPRSTVLSHAHRAKKTLKSRLAHMDHTAIRPRCPACASRNLLRLDKKNRPITNEKTKISGYTCAVCDSSGPAAEYQPQDAPVYQLGRNNPPDVSKWTRETVGPDLLFTHAHLDALPPNIPAEDAPTIPNLDGWTRPENGPTYYESTVLPPHKPAYPNDYQTHEPADQHTLGAYDLYTNDPGSPRHAQPWKEEHPLT